MKALKKIDKIILIAFSAVVVVVMALVPTLSYVSYVSSLPVPPRITMLNVSMDDEFGAYTDLNAMTAKVVGVLDNGSKKSLTEEEYSLSFTPALAEDGKAAINTRYTCRVSYNADTSVYSDIALMPQTYIQAEEASITGGSAISENGISAAGNFKPEQGEASVAFSFYVNGNIDCDLQLRASNGYLQGTSPDNLNDNNGVVWTEAVQVNKILKLYVNDTEVHITNDIQLPRSEDIPESQWATLFSRYYTLTFDNLAFNNGLNTVKVELVTTDEMQNIWGESPSMNFDYLRVLPVGGEGQDGKIQALEYMGLEQLALNSGISLDGDDVFDIFEDEYMLRGIYENGCVRYFPNTDFDITVEGNTAGVTQLGGNYVIKATHKTLEGIGFSVPVTVGNTVDVYSAVITGGGSIKTDASPAYIGDLQSNSVVTYNFNWSGEGATDIVFTAANGYLVEATEAETQENVTMYKMMELQLNTIIDIYVNDVQYAISDGIKLSASEPSSGFVELYTNFEQLLLEDVPLLNGQNKIEIRFKQSTAGQVNFWNESPRINVSSLEIGATLDSTEQ